jgi:hypothetical protein
MAISLPLSYAVVSLRCPTFYYQTISPAEILEIVAGNNPIIAKEETDSRTGFLLPTKDFILL